MIFTERKITVRNGKSCIDEPIILYRGDYEVEIRFTITETKYRFKSGMNLVDSEKASYAQLALLAPDGTSVFTGVGRCEDGIAIFVLTKDMIDEINEVGLYSFQIRLFDYYRESRVSIPPVEFGIEVREPVASEDHTNIVNDAIVGYSIANIGVIDESVPETFDSIGQYNKTNWSTGGRISDKKLNKIEDAIDTINKNSINEHALLDRKIATNYSIFDNRINQLSSLSEGSTTGDAELMDIRIGADAIKYDSAGSAVRNQINRINTAFDELADVIAPQQKRVVNFNETKSNFIYSTVYPNGLAFNGYTSYIKNVSEGEEYYLTSTTPPGVSHGLAYLYDTNGNQTVVKQNIKVGEISYNDFRIRIPANITRMIVVTANSNIPILSHLSRDYDIFKHEHETITDVLYSTSKVNTDFDVVYQNTIYSTSYPDGLTFDGYTSYAKNVSVGEEYFLTSKTIPNNKYGLAYLFNNAGEMIEIIEQNKEYESIDYTDYMIKIPENITRMIVTTTSDYTPSLVTYQLSMDDFENMQMLTTQLNKYLIDNLLYERVKFSKIESGIIYSIKYPNGHPFNKFTSYIKNVSEGEEYYLTSTTVYNSKYALAYLYDAAGNLVRVEKQNTSDESISYTNYKIIIPKNVSKLVITTSDADGAPMLGVRSYDFKFTSGKIGYKLHDNKIWVSQKYGTDMDLMISLMPKGGNGLLDFYEFGTIKNPSPFPSTYFDGVVLAQTSTTDWHSPYIVTADQNADGDNFITGTTNFHRYFTGGNHQYDNTGTGSSSTARLISLRYFIDGHEISEGEGYANNIEIRWVDRVQGYNTSKLDGSGREILQENHTLTYDGVYWKSHTEVIPLEDITMDTWYAFQCKFATMYNGNAKFVGGSNRSSINNIDGYAADCGDGRGYRMEFTKDIHGVSMEIDPLYDMGGYEDHGIPFSMAKAYGKAYFNLVNSTTKFPMKQGNSYSVRGSWKFFRV